MTIKDAAILVALSLLIVFAGYAFAGDLPDPAMTPGVADPALTAEVLCAKGFTTRSVRNVPAAVKRKVYAAYHMSPKKAPCPCEIDHLVSLEIGGANDPKNLWPEPFNTRPWNAHVKDKLENRLHKEVCEGNISLEDAQKVISDDWRESYKKYFGEP